jgi:hypothetical protein
MTNNKITANTTITNSMQWDTAQICEAHFMYPTEHFQDADELIALDEEVFSNMMIAMVELLPPLSDSEKQGLKKAVLSGNRLRTYYLVLKLVDHYADCLAETQDCNETPSTASSLEHRGYQIMQPEAL